jgi:hypothetical protein
MSEPTREELLAKIAELEALAAKPERVHRTRRKSDAKAAKDAAKARRKQFKLEAQKRARLHCSLNRYAR